MLRPLIPILTLLTSSIAWATPPSQVSFPSADALPVTADVYAPHSSEAPTIVLFHQAGWSRGEYAEIAPKLNTMGFNCIAIDQRSGDGVGGVKNQTSRAAKQKKLGTRYVDARQDMVAALRYAKKRFGTPVLAWGSSYSSSLALHIAGSEPGLVDGVLAFSPGEYFSGQGKGSRYVTEAARKIQVPAFLTSSKSEGSSVRPIFEAIGTAKKTQFVPGTRGNHGSRALWERFDDHRSYWKAVTQFLSAHFPKENRP